MEGARSLGATAGCKVAEEGKYKKAKQNVLIYTGEVVINLMCNQDKGNRLSISLYLIVKPEITLPFQSFTFCAHLLSC